MSRVLMGLLVLISTMVHAENVLHVKAGQTHEVSAQQAELTYDKLILEDGAVLKIASELEQLQLDAPWVEIGQDVKILAQGQDGQAGAVGESRSGQADECEAGKPGGDGGHGTQGGDGVALNMVLGIAKLGSMTVNSRGGAGGAGGAGGQGEQGGSFDKCRGLAGGEGGAGGDGGDGGNGGQVTITYRMLTDQIKDPVASLITVQNGGGTGGAAGTPGKGGAGTEGKYITMRSLTGSQKWMPGGPEGQPGKSGKPGRDGVKGQVLIQQDLRDRMDSMIQTQSAQVTALKDQLVQKLAEEKRQVEAAAKDAVAALEAKVTTLQANLDGRANQTSVDQSISDIKQGMAQQAARMDELSAKMEQSLKAMQSQLDLLTKQVKSLDNQVNSSSGSPSKQ